MKIYKIYRESGESRKNTAAAFQEEMMLQDGEGEFFISREEAVKAYNPTEDMGMAQRLTYAGSCTYRYDGKLLEVAEIPDDEYKEAIADGEALRYIYLNASTWEVELIETSKPYVHCSVDEIREIIAEDEGGFVEGEFIFDGDCYALKVKSVSVERGTVTVGIISCEVTNEINNPNRLDPEALFDSDLGEFFRVSEWGGEYFGTIDEDGEIRYDF